MFRHAKSLAVICSVAVGGAACAPAPSDAIAAPSAAAPSTATTPSTTPPRDKGGAHGAKPEVVEVAAIVGAIKAAYDTYKQIYDFLNQGAPTAEDQIIAQLTTLEQQFAAMKTELDGINQSILNLIYQEQRTYFLQNLQQIELIRAGARTAAEEIAQWKAGGKSDALMLNNALHDSLSAANQLLEGTAFFMHPASTAGAPDVFDYRSALPAYLYALTVRQGVLSIADPQFRYSAIYQAEFKAHYARLQELLSQIDALPQCHADAGYAPNLGTFRTCSYCLDPLSGNTRAVAGSYTWVATPFCINPIPGTQDDANNALQFYSFYDAYDVREEMGYWETRDMANLIYANTYTPSLWIIPILLPNYQPLIGYGGKCMQIDQYGYVNMLTCNGKPEQQWYLFGDGTLQNQAGKALESELWMTHNGTALLGVTPVEKTAQTWSIDSQGVIHGRGGKCVDIAGFNTNDYAGVQLWDCTGGANQRWLRQKPIIIPVPIHVGGLPH